MWLVVRWGGEYYCLVATCHVMSCHVSPVLQMYSSTTKYYSRTTLYYKVLLQYYSALQSTTPVLLCTTKYYSTTTPVLQSTTPVLLCTTKYYSWLILDVWNVIYNARNNKSHPPTSPNTAPAMQNESHDWSASHMKRHLQCAEQQESFSNFTKYCACHAKWISWLIRITYETSFTMRGATSAILQPHQILRLPRKMNLMLNSLHTWNAIYNARSDRQRPPTSPNTAPATKNEFHAEFSSHMKRYLQCAVRQATSPNLTKYCACHEKWIPCWILFTHETLFTMRGARGNILQPHQILRLPRKMTFQNLRKIWWKQMKRHFQCATDPSMIRAWSDHENAKLNPPRRRGYFRARQKQILLKITTFRAPAIIPNFTEYCACHEKWHLNFTKYCACHEK